MNISEMQQLKTCAIGFVKNPREYVKNIFPEFASITPYEGVIYMLMVDDKAVGMGALRKLEDGVGEIKRCIFDPSIRGRVMVRR